MPTTPGRYRLLLLVLPLALVATGCTSMSYDRIRLGAAPSEYDRALPDATTRRTTVGLTHWVDSATASEAVVVLLSDDRRVAGKLHARRANDVAGGPWRLVDNPRYELVGELDRSLYEVSDTSPIDVLRMLLVDLSGDGPEPLVRNAHDLIMAGLARALARWPGVDDPGIGKSDLERLEDLAPPDGALDLALSGNRLRFSYRVD